MVQRDDAVIVNALVRQALVSAQEVMGENGLNAVLRTSGLERYVGSFPPDNLEPASKAWSIRGSTKPLRSSTVAVGADVKAYWQGFVSIWCA